MYRIEIKPRMCRSDAEVEALRGDLPVIADCEDFIEEDALVFERIEGKECVLARLVRNCLGKKLVIDSAKLLRTVHGDLSNRGSVISKGAMMNRERASDGSLRPTIAVPRSVLQLLPEQNARLGLTGPYSAILGYFKTPRERSCHLTAWSRDRRDIFEISSFLAKEVEYVYKHELPNPWRQQREFMKQVSRRFRYPHSVFSTVTINLNVRCAYHTDSGDFRDGMGNLVVLELGREDSGILVMPRERVAFLVRPTDLLLMNVHHMHGNLPLTVGGTRLTAVLYARERHIDCGK